MEIPVSAQALTFAQGALLGLGLCLAYDLLRALRQLCPRTGPVSYTHLRAHET